jgi:seryl-tRNA synthetase
MLDLTYVRENLEDVRAALEKRGMPTAPLDDFVRADAERRRVIAESDQFNAERNAASREIGGLMKEGKREEAEMRRAQVNELKVRIGELDRLRDESEARMRELLSTLPNIPHETVPVGKSDAGAQSPNLISSQRIMLTWAQRSTFSTSSGRRRLPALALPS